MLGVLTYVVLGGFVAAFVVTYLPLQVTQTEGSPVPSAVYALIIGSAWTTYLGALGVSGAEEKAQQSLEQLTKRANKLLTTMAKHAESAADPARKRSLDVLSRESEDLLSQAQRELDAERVVQSAVIARKLRR